MSRDAHYGTRGNAELNFRCCEPHCREDLEATRPAYGTAEFWPWLSTDSHRIVIVIVLGDGIDFCPPPPGNASMPEPCASGGSLLGANTDCVQELGEDLNVNLYPVYYGNNAAARADDDGLKQGQGALFNPSTPEELEAPFAEIVWRSQVVLVPH